MNRFLLSRARTVAAALSLALAGGLLSAPATASPERGGNAAPRTSDLVVWLRPGAALDPVTKLLSRVGWSVTHRHGDPSGDLLRLRATRLLAVPVSATTQLLRALPVIRAVEDDVAYAIGGRYGGEQSQVASYADELESVHMVHQVAYDRVGLRSIARDTRPAPGVRVAVLDGGFDLAHEALAGRCDLGYDVLDGDRDPNDRGNRRDDDGDRGIDTGVGHGTAVAGLVAIGAPGCRVVPVRILDDEGNGTLFGLTAGLRWATAQRVAVINVSAGSDRSSDIVEAALADAAARGILVIAAAGNSGDAGTIFPGASRSVLCVSGVLADGARDPVAAADSHVDLVAPSRFLIAPASVGSRSYAYVFGTSYACALASAVAAHSLGLQPAVPRARGAEMEALARPHGAAAAPWAGRLGRGSVDATPFLADDVR